MKKEFVTYELALRMKQLGFDEPCFGYYLEDGEWQPASYSYNGTVYPSNKDLLLLWVSAPLFQQAFRWFREKYDLFGKIYIVNFGADEYSFDVYDLYEEKTKYDNFIGAGTSYSGTFDTYEEAEFACLEKLIEIVESKSE
jgi:hypothetical protein